MRHRRTFAAIALAAIAAPALAQPSEAAAVAQAVDALSRAIIAVDRAQLTALTSPDLSYGHSAGRTENQAEFIAYLESRAAAFRSINLSDQTIAISENEAIVRHILTGETVNPQGQVTPVRIGVLQVWRKDGNNWRLLARQAFRL
ncbi:MAG TPA: nuclear transport factor 2 family protein [Acetobacteraceae bacterium]|nr:nuclear transport factor 2 family protein [Acetobacteraceae bacterium]